MVLAFVHLLDNEHVPIGAVFSRRTHSSRIPFEDGESIGYHLPRGQAALMRCSFNEKEMQGYKEYEDELTGSIIAIRRTFFIS